MGRTVVLYNTDLLCIMGVGRAVALGVLCKHPGHPFLWFGQMKKKKKKFSEKKNHLLSSCVHVKSFATIDGVP